MILETPGSKEDYALGKQIQQITFPAAYRHWDLGMDGVHIGNGSECRKTSLLSALVRQ